MVYAAIIRFFVAIIRVSVAITSRKYTIIPQSKVKESKVKESKGK